MSLGILFLAPLIFGLAQLIPMKDSRKLVLIITCFAAILGSWLSVFFGGGMKVVAIGNWPPYAGIVWVADGLSMVFCLGVILLYLPTCLSIRKMGARMLLLFHFLVASTLGSFLTGDLFNLFVMFEILLLSSYALFFSIERLSQASLFIWANIIGSVVFLFGTAYVYISLGTVNLSDISVRFFELDSFSRQLIYCAIGFVFCLKAGIWPLYLWMPSSYPNLPTPLLAFISAIAAKVGLYCLVRWTTLLGADNYEDFIMYLYFLAVFSIVMPGIAAFRQSSLKLSFCYFGVSHVGLMLMAFLIFNSHSLTGLLIYFLNDCLVAAGMFFLLADIEKAGNPKVIFKKQAVVGALFLALGLSAAGVPPFGGFWGKWWVLKSSYQSPEFFFMILGSAFLYLFFIIFIWNRQFVGEEKAESKSEQKIKISFSPVYCLCLSLLIAVSALFVPDIYFKAGSHASDRNLYITLIQSAKRQVEFERQRSLREVNER